MEQLWQGKPNMKFDGLRAFAMAGIMGLMSVNAQAADLSLGQYQTYTAPFNWTGWHADFIAGYAIDNKDVDYLYSGVPTNVIPLLPTGADLNGNGSSIGGALGYDGQFSGVVIGIEGDFSWMNVEGQDRSVVEGDPAIGLPTLNFKTDYQLDWLSTVRGRVGVPVNKNLLIYGTGGLAFGKVSTDTSVNVGNLGTLKGSSSDTKTGWTAGGGAELAVAGNFTLKAEALYFDLGDVSYSAVNRLTTGSVNTQKDLNGVVVRGGVGYHF